MQTTVVPTRHDHRDEPSPFMEALLAETDRRIRAAQEPPRVQSRSATRAIGPDAAPLPRPNAFD